MKLKLPLVLLSIFSALVVKAQRATPDRESVRGGELIIQPIMHASLVLTYHNKIIYVDPTGGSASYKGIAAPDIILITDIHGDHYDSATVEAVNTKKATIVAPQVVVSKLSTRSKQKVVMMKNGDRVMQEGIAIAAIPMYNLPEAPNAFHVKGRGNGYILSVGAKNVYISGDTEDTPEMRALKNIDIAFICMNLPYTMDVNQAAQGVLAFKPKVVYPYHYRGQNVNTFKNLVNAADKNIEVRLREWYPSN
jgi:L-ascorbate metabolism protein UlaG (beta-lactamase superfamily)